MNIWTYGQIIDKVTNDLDLQNEGFILPDEYVGLCNEALDEAEAEIHKIHEDYLLTSGTLSLVQGQTDYPLSGLNIYANKIRGVIYQNGALTYPVKRIRGDKKFYDIAMTEAYGTGMEYRYFIKNPSIGQGFILVLAPAARENGPYLTVWFLRTIARVPTIASGSLSATRATQIDIPEFGNFIIQFMKTRCLEKEGDPRFEGAVQILQQQRKMMVDTLTQMIPDDDDGIALDLSHYAEHE